MEERAREKVNKVRWYCKRERERKGEESEREIEERETHIHRKKRYIDKDTKREVR